MSDSPRFEDIDGDTSKESSTIPQFLLLQNAALLSRPPLFSAVRPLGLDLLRASLVQHWHQGEHLCNWAPPEVDWPDGVEDGSRRGFVRVRLRLRMALPRPSRRSADGIREPASPLESHRHPLRARPDSRHPAARPPSPTTRGRPGTRLPHQERHPNSDRGRNPLEPIRPPATTSAESDPPTPMRYTGATWKRKRDLVNP